MSLKVASQARVLNETLQTTHVYVIKWKHFPRYWPFLRGIHRSSVNSPHKGQTRGALMFPFFCAWANGWTDDDVLGRHYIHYDVTVITLTETEAWKSNHECGMSLFIPVRSERSRQRLCPSILYFGGVKTNQPLKLAHVFVIISHA